jgi:hypothetical protein
LLMRSCCANCWRTLIRRATSERPCAGSNASSTSGCRRSPRSHLPRQPSPNFDTATEELASRSLSVCFIVARLRRVGRPRTATTFGQLRIAEVSRYQFTEPPDCQEGGGPPSDNPAVLYEDSSRRRGGEGGVTTSGESREYWAWRRSKQGPTLRRSLEIADAKINRELATRPARRRRRQAARGRPVRRARAGERSDPGCRGGVRRHRDHLAGHNSPAVEARCVPALHVVRGGSGLFGTPV